MIKNAQNEQRGINILHEIKYILFNTDIQYAQGNMKKTGIKNKGGDPGFRKLHS
jgi:hypothetical protein